MKDSILVVDDIEINRVILREILSDKYEILEAADGREALDILFNIPKLPEAILLDIMMPEMDGYEVLNAIKSTLFTKHIPVLFITAADASDNESRGLNEGAVDFIPKPFNSDVIQARLNNHIQLKKYRQSLQVMLNQKSAELVRLHESTLETMASLIEYRSMESGEHIRRTSELTRILTNQLVSDSAYSRDLASINRETLFKATALHDIGKIAIPDNILLKPGRLDEQEFAVIKSHTTIGSEIIRKMRANLSDEVEYLERAEEICRSHHEWWNGKGYPDGLAETDIPLTARILAVVDVYDALVSERCYKAALPHEKAVSIIMGASGTQFDPVIANAFFSVHQKFADLENEFTAKSPVAKKTDDNLD